MGPGARVSLVAEQLPRSAGLARIVSVSRTFGECRARDTQVALPHCVVPFPLLVILCSSKRRLAQQDDPGQLVPGAPSPYHGSQTGRFRNKQSTWGYIDRLSFHH